MVDYFTEETIALKQWQMKNIMYRYNLSFFQKWALESLQSSVYDCDKIRVQTFVIQYLCPF